MADQLQPQLRRALNSMFPPEYLRARHHQPEAPVCSLLQTRCRQSAASFDDTETWQNECCHCEVSSEPSSRADVINLRSHLEESLRQHQAKRSGLCPVRRRIYDQLFDELIRQVTVGCIEQGQLLAAVRDELRLALDACGRLYQSGVEFGLRKALRAELELEQVNRQSQKDQSEARMELREALEEARRKELETRNKLDGLDQMVAHFEAELAQKEQVIGQQRAVIKALAKEAASELESPKFEVNYHNNQQ